ncbi:MAG: lysozyme [Paludibacteraceae bacterium]|nr:lysozyme [Paludibacteraceae bacterium]
MKREHKIYIIIAASATAIAVALAVYFLYYLPNKKTMGNKKLSAKGAFFIKLKEGFESVAYNKLDGIWTIGYGHTLGVRQGMTCTRAEADAWFLQDVAKCEASVNKQNLKLSQNQFDALVSYAYNIGVGAFERSNLLAMIKSGKPEAEIRKWWTTTWITVSKKVIPGLVTRRAEEAAMFFA